MGLADFEQAPVHPDRGGGPYGRRIYPDGHDARVHRARHVAPAAILAGEPQSCDAHPPRRVRGDQHHGDEVHAAARTHAHPFHHVLGGDVDAVAEWTLAAASHRTRAQVPLFNDGDIVLLLGPLPRHPNHDVPLHDP